MITWNNDGSDSPESKIRPISISGDERTQKLQSFLESGKVELGMGNLTLHLDCPNFLTRGLEDTVSGKVYFTQQGSTTTFSDDDTEAFFENIKTTLKKSGFSAELQQDGEFHVTLVPAMNAQALMKGLFDALVPDEQKKNIRR